MTPEEILLRDAFLLGIELKRFWFVGPACLFVFIGLFVRGLGAWYRVQCAVEDNTAYVLISTRGILADKDRVIKKLQKM